MEKPIGLIAGTIEGIDNPLDSSAAIAASERALNSAILATDISRSYEEHLETFDQFYAEDLQATTETLKEPVEGKAAVRARLAHFLIPLHVFAEIG